MKCFVAGATGLVGGWRKCNLVAVGHQAVAWVRKHNATIGCPMTTGMFGRIAAEAAAEDEAAGKKRITPYWRTLIAGGELNPKYPGGVKQQTKRLTADGHQVKMKGKQFLVEDFGTTLARLKGPST